MQPDKFSAPVLHDLVTEWVADRIANGDLRPGRRIEPLQLARDMGISHIPVREALQALAGEGRITWLPRRGFFVPDLDIDSLEHIYHWRTVIESEAYRLTMPHVRDEDADQMDKLCGELEQALQEQDTLAYRKIHWQFHLIPLRRQPSQLPIRFLHYLWDEADRHALPHFSQDVDMPRLQRQHRQLVKALRDRDLNRVLSIMSEHRHLSLPQTMAAADAARAGAEG